MSLILYRGNEVKKSHYNKTVGERGVSNSTPLIENFSGDMKLIFVRWQHRIRTQCFESLFAHRHLSVSTDFIGDSLHPLN